MTIDYRIDKTASEQGWHVVALCQHRPRPGTVAHGVALLERRDHPIPGKPFAVNGYALRRDGVSFFAGEYDLDEETALGSFTSRIRQEPLSREFSEPELEEVEHESEPENPLHNPLTVDHDHGFARSGQPEEVEAELND